MARTVQQLFDLTGKVAIVTGSSRGIGRSIALAFAAAGANVSICARGEDGLRATAAELAAFGHKVHTAPCDLGNGPAVTGYLQAAAEALGGIDVLVGHLHIGVLGGDFVHRPRPQ